MTFDPTAKHALRCSPTVEFKGPFFGPDSDGYISALVDGRFRQWNADGVANNSVTSLDLVPLQIVPERVIQPFYDKGRTFTLVELRPGERIVDAAGQVTHE